MMPRFNTKSMLYGVTLDSLEKIDQIVPALTHLPRQPMTCRVVFDAEMKPASYAQALKKLTAVSYVLGEPVDSSDMKRYSVNEYLKRFETYMDRLGRLVNVWEIGNEINGDWLGKTSMVVQKMEGAYRIAKARKVPTALTLYYNRGCVEDERHEMMAWAEKEISPELKRGLDYVLVSFYEDDCQGVTPDWKQVFADLGQMFPKARLGIGECGTREDGLKASLLRHYYSMRELHPRFIGGYFWWYFVQDMLPYQANPLWDELSSVLKT